MSSNFAGVTFENQAATPSDDAVIRRAILSDGILDGCELSYTGSTLTMAAGQMMICGRQVKHTSTQNWAVADETTGYARLLLTTDLTRTSTKDTFDQVVDTIEYASSIDGFASLVQEDINASGTRYQIVAAVVSLAAGGISAIVDKLGQSSSSLGSVYAVIDTTYPEGATCTCTNGTKTFTAPDTSGQALFIVPTAGEWIVTAVQGNDTATAILNIIEPKAYVVVLDFLVPFDYQRVEYIQSDGNQYIKTGYQLENASKVAKTSFAFDAAFINATNQAAVYNIMGSGSYFMGWDKSSANKIVFAVGTGDTKTYSFTRDNGRHVWAADPSTGIIKFDDEILYSGNFNGSLGGYPELWLCIGSLNITTPSRLYGAEIKYDGEIVHQYYPCYRKNDNVVGVWDFVEKEFLTNAGSGLFIAGGDIQ